jgi:hypothetical protein
MCYQLLGSYQQFIVRLEVFYSVQRAAPHDPPSTDLNTTTKD